MMTVEVKSKWEMKPLGDCLLFMSRGVAPSYVSDSPIAALNQKAIRWGYIEKDYLKHHDPAKRVKQDVFIRQGDIVVNSTGDITIGRAYYFNKPWPNLFADSHVTILRLNSDVLLPEFCIYLFPLPEYQNKIYGLVTGATGQLELSKSNLSKLEVVVPPLPTQRKIATILSAYDDLIENNLRRIKVLEEIAQNLYREWFVKFRFPGHEQARFVDSPFGRIPEGWDVVPFSALASYVNGYAFKPEDWGKEGKPIIKIKELKAGITADTPRNVGDGIPEKYNVSDGDVLFSWSADLDAYLWRGGNGLLNQHLFNVVPFDGFTRAFCFHALQEMMPRFRALSLGATMHHIKRSALDQVYSIVPPAELRKRLDIFIGPMHGQIITLTKHVQNLRRTHDLLLQRLLSGQINLTETEITQ